MKVSRGLLKVSFRNTSYYISAASVLLSSFLIAFFVGSFFLRPQPSRAVTGLSLANSPHITLASSDNALALSPVPGLNQGLASSTHTLTAATNVPTGYQLSLSTPVVPALATTGGTITQPTTLAQNTWGFAIASPSVVGVTNDFDVSYASPTPSPGSRWANPASGATIRRTTGPADAPGDEQAVYYGVKVDMNLASGTYNNTVRYTAVANIAAIPQPAIISVSPNSGTTAGGTTITIVGTGFTVNGRSVTTSVQLGDSACTNVSIASDTPIVGRDTIVCDTPAHTAGAVHVRVTNWVNVAIAVNSFTYAPPANITFVSPSTASTTPGTESGPALTIAGTNFTGATSVTIGGTPCQSFQVVSDTHIFCKAPNTITTTGQKVIQVTKPGIPSTSTTSVAYNNTNYPTLQASNTFSQCTTTAKLFRDTRDSQLYYVKKMPDNKCWMVDNLKYANYGTLSQEAGKYLTANGTNTANATNFDVAKYVDPGAVNYCKGNTNIPTNTNTRCGLLYNWYAATNGTGTYSQSTQGTNVTGSICPANFRLPSATSNNTTATGSGMGYSAADFAVLNASMNAGTLITPGAITPSYYAGWQPSGAWGGTFSGYWDSGFVNQGIDGGVRSSTADSAVNARLLNFNSNIVSPGTVAGSKPYGRAVRCLMENPAPTPPPGTNPPNISTTNPAVLDVYPTTGWTGDTIAITSNALFTNVTSVTIGGTACSQWGIVTTSLITCKLPAKTAGTTNNIVVTNNGTNVTNAATYTHMKITYFNPNSSNVAIGGVNYVFYADGIDNYSCSYITPSNSHIASTPNSSIVYVRDTRNNQTYKVKKMADGRCWMVDNLKYISTTIANASDSTTGMTYNNGDHLNSGTTGKTNTVNGTSTQSTANNDKAFYNNPMSASYCYGTTNMPANTLTNCGYLYNWYAATNGTGTYAQSTDGTNVTGSICPTNFRLPSVMSNGTTATSNGTSINAADFTILNASMNAGVLTIPGVASNYYANWQPSGAWGGTFSGRWNSSLVNQGSSGYFWSSTVYSVYYARFLAIDGAFVYLSNNNYNESYYDAKYYGLPIRCVLDQN